VSDLPPPGSTLREVLPGVPEDLDDLAAKLEAYVDAVMTAVRGRRELNANGWVGKAADAFWESVTDVLKKLEDGAVAFQEGALALRTYTAALREAQADVGRALRLIEQAETETRIWQARNAEALASNVTVSFTGIPALISADDPGEAVRRQAGDLIVEAKGRVDAAARHAAHRLDLAADHAPQKPGFWSRRWHDATEFAGGAVEATAGMATFTFKVSPAYAIIDPESYIKNQVGIVKGLAHGVTHPVDFAKAVVDWDTWAESPGRALGHLLPAVALAVASGGAGAAGRGAKAAEGAEALRGAEVVARGAAAGMTDAEASGILRAAAAGKGNFGIGSATAAEAEELGRAWVGARYHLASDGKTLVSENRLRQYRPPSYKPKLGKAQSNFEQRWEPSTPWQSNGHLDIKDR
jgi:type VII secretion system ESX-1 substrate